MKRAISLGLILVLSGYAGSVYAQRSASATMTITATVVESTRLIASVSEDKAVVSAQGITPFDMTINATSRTGEPVMKTALASERPIPSNMSLSTDETVLSYGRTTVSTRRRIEVDHAHLSAKPAAYTVTVRYF